MSEFRHLRRLDHAWEKQPVYFITACVNGRRPVLANPEAYGVLLEEWAAMRERHGWWVGSYVVMPDHVHFFTTPAPGRDSSLSMTVGKWKEWTAKRILKLTARSGTLWQPEFFDHLLRSEESMAQKWDYVRENPVRAGLVERREDWPYVGSVDFA